MSKIIVIAIVVVLVIVGVVTWVALRTQTTVTELTGPVLSVTAVNQTRNVDATAVTAAPKDVIAYTLTAENHTDKNIPGYVMQVDISEIASSATLVDSGGASYNSATNSLVWTPLDIEPNGNISKKFIVRVNPIAVRGSTGRMHLTFNNDLNVNVGTPGTIAGAAVANPVPNQAPYIAPTTGTSENIALILSFFATLAIFGARKSLKKA